jgi:flagellar biosynthetic protein FlhB
MAETDLQERTERATPRRLQQARERGQVARSRELITMAMLLCGAGAWLFLGADVVERLAGLMRQAFHLERAQIFDAMAGPRMLGGAVMAALSVVAPLLALLVASAIASAVAVGGLSFSAKAIALQWERLDPVRGMGRVFSARGLAELGKAFAKFALIGAIAVWWLLGHAGDFLGLGDEPLQSGIAHAGRLLVWSVLIISMGTVAIAAVDVPLQLWQHARQLRMTREDVREELKETEGRPEVRSRIRRLQREVASRRMMQQVPRADVVVTNPTHYAVALRYDAARMRAPRVVAKGADLLAVAIRRLAEAHAVPVLSAPPLARALYYSTELDREIPAGLYHAVAQVLAYIYQLRQAPPGSAHVAPPADLPIPEEFRRDRRGRHRHE